MIKILVVEDDLDVIENLQEILEINNYQVLTANNGRDGLKVLEREKPDLIISDINMPIMNGLEFLNELRKDVNNVAIPFLFLTAKVEKTDYRVGMNLGADDYITKPFKMSDVINAINTRIEKYKNFKILYDEKLNNLRKNVAMSLPHEFRTPLNSIIGFSQFLHEAYDELKRDDVLSMVSNIYDAGMRLLKLVSNYNYYTNLITNYNFQESSEQATLVHLNPIQEIAQTLTEKYTKNVSFEIEVEELNLNIREGHLRKIYEELIDNAIKFANSHTEIRIVGRKINNYYFFKITNYGILLSSNDVKEIDAFMQFNRSSFEQQGTGLGLVIVKKILELYGGNLDADNFEGQGAQIKISIPIM